MSFILLQIGHADVRTVFSNANFMFPLHAVLRLLVSIPCGTSEQIFVMLRHALFVP